MMAGMDQLDQAAALGFKREDAERSLATFAAVAFPASASDVAMDLARFVKIPLLDATWALILPKRLRRLGINVPKDADPLDFVRAEVAGQAESYAKTFYGSLDVREAQGHTFSRVFLDTIERWFGPR